MPLKKKKLLYAGDSQVGGPANYLLGVLKTLPLSVTHIPPGQRVSGNIARRGVYDAFIFSDFSCRDLSSPAELNIMESVKKEGAGLLMIGGWGSFSGPFGHWRGSGIERLLPVSCLPKDDRRNISQGLLIEKKSDHPVLRSSSFRDAPMICGLNEVRVRRTGKVLLRARELKNRPGHVALGRRNYPLLVVDDTDGRRRAALTTDLAPHWCGGWVDWGKARRTLPVTDKISIEVGEQYVRFICSLVRWLIRT